MTSRRAVALTLVAAAPALVLAALEASVLAIALFAGHPRWPDPALNLTEATAVRDHAEVLRLLDRGENPNAPRQVRPGLLGNDAEVTATPLAAAVSIRRTERVRLLFARATVADAEWLRLRCAAAALGFDDVVALLDRRRPGVTAHCTGTERLW